MCDNEQDLYSANLSAKKSAPQEETLSQYEQYEFNFSPIPENDAMGREMFWLDIGRV